MAFVASAPRTAASGVRPAPCWSWGEPADGPLVALPADQSHGWIRVEDELGHRHLVFVPIRGLTGRKVGDILGFTVSVNDTGALAQQVELVEDDKAA